MLNFQPKEMNLINPTWVYILLLILNQVVDAQSSMEPVPTYINHHTWEPSIAITVGAILCALLFMAIVSIYLRNCTESRIIITQTTPCSCSCGINKDLLNTFPIIFYSNVKDLKMGKGELECAVCLSDFKDYDALRLLPKCNHVFHSQCIDSWLASHVTCPVCRANLNQDSCQVNITIQTHSNSDQTSEESITTSPENINNETEPNPNQNTNIGALVETRYDSNKKTTVRVPEKTQVERTSLSTPNPTTNTNTNQEEIEHNMDQAEGPKRNLMRSNSTGHSLIEQGKNVERYTLRLPEDVRRYILLNHGRRVQRSASYHNVKGLCWSDSEGSSVGKRVNGEVKVICAPPFVSRHG